jgi:CheY-like chemotaxis protein
MESIASNSILLADDNQTFLMYIGILIRRLGYQIFLARDGLEALKIAKEKKPTIIILDYIMPRLDGSSCLSMIRNDADLRNTPVLIITSYGDKLSMDELVGLGCCGFLKKPVNLSDFYSTIRGCLPTGSKGFNKRRNIRTQSNLKVLIKCKSERRELYASKLSQEGMYLRTIAPFEVGTIMDIVFQVDDEDPVELKGSVIYCNRLSARIEPEPGMGIKFMDIPADVKQRIYYFVIKELTQDIAVDSEIIEKEFGCNDL